MNIGIIGHFGGKEKFNDGQTVKTVTLYDALVRNLNGHMVHKIDTYYARRNPFRFLFELLVCFARDKKIIVLPETNGRKILFPFFYLASTILKKQIYHNVVGGRFHKELKKNPKWLKYAKSFDGTWVESHLLVSYLKDLGLERVYFLPNFKNLQILKKNDIKKVYEEPFRFCIFSRVMKEKGVSDAIDAVIQINSEKGRNLVELDIYGPIEAGYKEEFDKKLKLSSDSCKYCGIIPQNESVKTIKEYYILLFPTHWKHEGIPGTIIDAFSSGVPVISRQWQYCDELIADGVTGFVYDWDTPEKLIDKMRLAIEQKDKIYEMKLNCLNEARKYSESVVIKQIFNYMDIEKG